MIHKMQEGIPEADLLNGLCYALVRNFKSSVLKNREVSKPVFLSGGVMKNIGVVGAIRDLLVLGVNDYILDDNSDYYCAIGAALSAEKTLTLEEIKQSVGCAATMEMSSALPPLSEFADISDEIEQNMLSYKARSWTYCVADRKRGRLYRPAKTLHHSARRLGCTKRLRLYVYADLSAYDGTGVSL